MRLLGDEKLSLDVDRKDSIDLVLADTLEVPKVLDTGVAHDYVDASELLLGLGEKLSNLLALAHVSLDADGPNAQPTSFLSNTLGGRRGRDVVDNDIGTVRSKLQDDSSANAAAGASD